MSRPDAAQLVRAAEQAITDENGEPDPSPIGPMTEIRVQDTAAVVTAAVLRELAGHLGPNDRPDHGNHWNPTALRELADYIDTAGPDIHETTWLIIREDFSVWLVTANSPQGAVEQFRRDRPGERHRGVFEERLHAEESNRG